MKKISLLLAGLLSIFLVACSNQKNADGKLNIVTTFYPVYEFTKQVAGDEANVELLIGAGTEPHDYEPSAKAVATIQDADAFVYENENMETWVPDLLKNLKNKEEKVIKATGNMLLLPGGEEEEDHDHGEEGHHHAYDPHVWLSPKRAIKMVENIRDSLSKSYPDKKAAFEKMQRLISRSWKPWIRNMRMGWPMPSKRALLLSTQPLTIWHWTMA